MEANTYILTYFKIFPYNGELGESSFSLVLSHCFQDTFYGGTPQNLKQFFCQTGNEQGKSPNRIPSLDTDLESNSDFRNSF